VLCVRDHGVGLAPEEFERVFERFWRADAARTRTTGGTGLGLAIAREDAAAHGGGLHATGRLGQGACFRLVLPVTQNLTSGEALEVPCAEQWEPPRSGSGRVTAGQRGAPRR
jgi:two-component system sensor histidine kinase MtrB